MLRRMLRRFLYDERGLETVEYSIVTGLVTAGTIGALVAIGTWVSQQFATVNTQLGA